MAVLKSLLLLGGVFAAAVQSQATTTCPKGLHIIAARGHGTAKGYGGLNLTVAAIKGAIKGSTSWAVPYYTYPSPYYNFQAEVMNGTNVMNTNVREFAKSCPTTPVVLLGYSEGACIMMNLLCGASSQGFTPSNPLPSSYAKQMIAIVPLGDETRTFGQPYNVGTCTLGQGGFPRKNPGGCSAFAPVMQSYCDSPDPECCGGNNETVHHGYPAEYDDSIVSYVASQYTSYRLAYPTTSSTSAKTTKTSTTLSTSTVPSATPPPTTSSTVSVPTSTAVTSSAVL